MNDNIFFRFIASKWFLLGLGIIMTLVLPITYKNMMVVYDAGQMGQYVWIPIVFIINLLTVIMAFYKFSAKLFSKPEVTSTEW